MSQTHTHNPELREEAAAAAPNPREDDSHLAEEPAGASASAGMPENDDFPRELDSAWPAPSAPAASEGVGDAHAELSEDDRASVEIGLRNDARREGEFESEAQPRDDEAVGLSLDELLEEPERQAPSSFERAQRGDDEPQEAFAPVMREVSPNHHLAAEEFARDQEKEPFAEAPATAGEPELAAERVPLPELPIDEVPNDLARELHTAAAEAHSTFEDALAGEATEVPQQEAPGGAVPESEVQDIAQRPAPQAAETRALEVHASRAARPEPYVRPGLFARLFGGGQRSTDERGIAHFEQKPGLLRVFARREYQRDAALAAIRSGFNDLSGLMRDIRDGLHASVDKQGELLDHLKYLPVVAQQNQDSARRFEEQALAQNRLQMQTIHAIREQIRGQSEATEQVNRVLSTIGREARDHKREIDDLEQRLERMRASDEAISSNLSSVGTAVRKVAEQGSAQSELVLRMQEAMEARTRQMEDLMRRQGQRQGWVMALALVLGFAALGAVAVVGYLYLRSTGAI